MTMAGRIIFGIWLCLAANAANAQVGTDDRLTAGAMRNLAQQLLDAGQPSAAGEVLNALLQRNPQDVTALILGAQAALDQNRPDAAVGLGGRAYGLTSDDQTRYVAARLVARAHAELRNNTRAMIWLRRAREFAPDAANADSVAQDYAFVRDLNPLAVDLSFGVSPSSNINNGTQSETITIGQFEFENNAAARPLAGIQYDAAANLRYRLSETADQATFGQVDLRTTTYSLGQPARDALRRDIDRARAAGRSTEDLPRTGRDFSYTVLSAGLIHRRVVLSGQAAAEFTLTAGKSWYGGDSYQTSLTLGAGQTFAMGPREQLRLNGSLRKDFADEKSAAFGTSAGAGVSRDVLTYAGSLGYARALDRGDVVSLSITDRISRSDDPERDYRSLQFGVDYQLGRPVMNVSLGVGLQVEERKFAESFFVPGVRRDYTVTTQVTAVLNGVEYYGFKPAVTVGLGRTFSEAERFATRFGTVGLEVRSVF